MPCPPLVPISVIPPVSQGVAPILWQNGNQITRLNIPLNPSFLVYDGTKTRWGDGSAQAPVYLPNIQEVNGSTVTYVAGITSTGQLVKTIGASGTALVGGTAGEVVYQTGPSATGFTAVGTTGQLLSSNGVSAPTWLNQSAIAAGSATTATTATNLASGVAGAMPYQSGVGATAFTAAGTTNQVLHSNGTSAPTWGSVSPSDLSIGHPTWNTSGNVGIGTSSPTTNLQVNGAIAVGNGSLTSMSINNNFGSNDLLTLAEGPQGLRIVNSGNTAEHLNINSSGNVGIGTSSPTSKLQLQTGGSTIQLDPSQAGGGNAYLNSVGASAGLFIGTSDAKYVSLYSNASERFRINSDGTITCSANPIKNCPTTAKAWGGGSSAGVIEPLTFGVSTITRSALGNYLVTMSTAINGYSIVATPNASVGNQATAQVVSTTQFRVYTFGGTGVAADAAFKFAVFGV
jgi:hypothetical protein